MPKLESKIAKLQIADEGLLKIRMGRILSITRRSIDAVKTAFGWPDTPTERVPISRMITHAPEPVGENTSVRKPPSFPTPQPNTPGQDKAAEDLLELQRICEAIGLDMKEVTGEPVPRAAMTRETHDLSNEVSDDVLKLIGHVEAANAQNSAFRPSANEHLEPATPPFGRIRATPLKSTNRESKPTPLFRESDLADVLASLKLRLLKIRLAPDDMAEAEAEITTAIAQLLSPRPKPPIIASSLQTLLFILESAGPSALTKDVEASLARLRVFLSQLDA